MNAIRKVMEKLKVRPGKKVSLKKIDPGWTASIKGKDQAEKLLQEIFKVKRLVISLRRYLAQPIVLLLGTADVKRDRGLNVRPGAMQQGQNRYERGRNLYATAQRIAQERGWELRWRLIEVPGVGHSARRMIGAAEAANAFSD